MIEEFASRMFVCRDIAHREHWKTKSYSEHVALGSFYESLLDKVDFIVESYQGQFGLIKNFEVKTRIVGKVADYLVSELDWLEEHREEIANNNAAILNMVDDVTALFQSTIYKLENLS